MSIIISKLCLELTPVEENILVHVMSELYIEKKRTFAITDLLVRICGILATELTRDIFFVLFD